ncbi:MotA/TolQ/ExbB proton channel family protein [Mariprofundus sp. EBB-1]|uniref:MotA/TolQ/ExbB proton channel family protein n=1 Tax=Mariprofundus sp. EBB-1 TaxID=2650971 RepID=UPI000EF1948A|nr:MotA/TolQ/ExbB proton channel family protein [Mariprofundus sp. EBB-1]RLL51603.1 MotA/TolQ/ExbB proton channel family protein [Mariprofundus sp. EBB-1]
MTDMIKSFIALIVSAISVHLAYIGFVRPQADLIMQMAKQAGQSAPRDILVIMKDYEQEICIILMIWAGYLILSKCMAILKDRYLFSVDLLDQSEQQGADLHSALTNLESLPVETKSTPLVMTLMASVRRYLITSDVQNTSDAIDSSIEAMAIRQDAGNSMIRYLIWAIPSIGFIGTVRGIGGALAQADQALAGDIGGMTNSLGLAFNSTFVALLISIVLMFMLHQLLRLQDGLVVDTQDYCEQFLLKRISEQ